jgi:polar amino acid transport system substrate-binding protein
MRRTLAALALVAVAALAAAAAAFPQTPQTLTPGRLAVALSMPSPGFQVGAVQGRKVVLAKGFEVDLAKALARRLGLRHVDFVNERRFASLFAAGDKPWDLGIAEVTITAARARNVEFSVPYLSADQGVLLRKNLPAVPRSIADLRGLKLCTQRGTTSADTIAEAIRPTRRPVLLTTEDLLLQRVQTGACDAAVFDLPVLATLRAQVPDRFGPIAGRIVTGETYGIVMEKGSPLKPLVDAALNELLAGSLVDRLERRWLQLDPGRVPVLR